MIIPVSIIKPFGYVGIPDCTERLAMSMIEGMTKMIEEELDSMGGISKHMDDEGMEGMAKVIEFQLLGMGATSAKCSVHHRRNVAGMRVGRVYITRFRVPNGGEYEQMHSGDVPL